MAKIDYQSLDRNLVALVEGAGEDSEYQSELDALRDALHTGELELDVTNLHHMMAMRTSAYDAIRTDTERVIVTHKRARVAEDKLIRDLAMVAVQLRPEPGEGVSAGDTSFDPDPIDYPNLYTGFYDMSTAGNQLKIDQQGRVILPAELVDKRLARNESHDGHFYTYDCTFALSSGPQLRYIGIFESRVAHSALGREKYKLNSKNQLTIPKTDFIPRGSRVAVVGLGDHIGIFGIRHYNKHKSELLADVSLRYQTTE